MTSGFKDLDLIYSKGGAGQQSEVTITGDHTNHVQADPREYGSEKEIEFFGKDSNICSRSNKIADVLDKVLKNPSSHRHRSKIKTARNPSQAISNYKTLRTKVESKLTEYSQSLTNPYSSSSSHNYSSIGILTRTEIATPIESLLMTKIYSRKSPITSTETNQIQSICTETDQTIVTST